VRLRALNEKMKTVYKLDQSLRIVSKLMVFRVKGVEIKMSALTSLLKRRRLLQLVFRPLMRMPSSGLWSVPDLGPPCSCRSARCCSRLEGRHAAGLRTTLPDGTEWMCLRSILKPYTAFLISPRGMPSTATSLPAQSRPYESVTQKACSWLSALPGLQSGSCQAPGV
jgi:hypothetical protein